MAAALANGVLWTNQNQNIRILFQQETFNNKIRVIAILFQRNVNGQFNDSGIFIPDIQIGIEQINREALRPGVRQKTLYLSELAPLQKMLLLITVEQRNITARVLSDTQAFLTIHAPP